MRLPFLRGSFFLPLIILLVLLGIVFTACNKTAQPLGLAAPNGFDFPTPTPAPVSGSVVVNVNYNGGVSGVTVNLFDPNGVKEASTTTTAGGNANFNFTSMAQGIWTAQVPTQGKFFQSSQTFSVPITGSNLINFSAGAQSIIASPVSIAYSTNDGVYYPVTISYSQTVPSGTAILSVPVSITMTSPTAGLTLSPFILGNGVNVLPGNVQKVFCQFQTRPVTFTATDFSGFVPIPQNVPVTFYRGYKTFVTLALTYFDDGSGNSTATMNLSLNSDGTDCLQAYNVSFNNANGCDTASASILPGQTKSFGGLCEYYNTNISLTAPNGTVINTSFNSGNYPVTNQLLINQAY